MANNKLYPPYIEGVIPSFFGDIISVPYSMNRAVSAKDVRGYSLKIKSVQNNFLGTVNIFCDYAISSPVSFTIPENIMKELRVGEFYKIQLAYIGEGNQISPYYSTVGVIKYTDKPNVFIDGLEAGQVAGHKYDYLGIYENQDKSEKVYSYNFKIFDQNDLVIADTGELIHNNTFDTEPQISYDNFSFKKDLEKGFSYYIQYTITTINKMVISSPKYRLIKQQTLELKLNSKFNAVLNFENGYVDLEMKAISNKLCTGAFCISRAKVDDINSWEEIYRFYISNQLLDGFLFRDFTVEQGKTYVYSIQQYNEKGLYSERVLSNKLFVDFEHAFLFDGTRQLKIKYNPKISSFKTTLLETKVDTLGSKYPFIFRNGNVEYKEFPISGLISCLMDEEYLFINKENSIPNNKHRTSTTSKDILLDYKENDLVGENYALERQFKMQVLDWLNNGEIKLFKSPSEGNFLVRLMNVSLTPNDTLGRMLHTFNATAYEIEEYNYSALSKYNIIVVEEPTTNNIFWKTISLHEIDKNKILTLNNLSQVVFTDIIPGDYFKINNEKIIIGSSGVYKASGSLNIEIDPRFVHQGTLTYQYFDRAIIKFDMIDNVSVRDYPLYQIIGEHENIISEINDIKTKILKYHQLYFRLRPVYEVHTKEEITDEYAIYKIGNEYYDGLKYSLFGKDKALISNYSSKFYFNGEDIDLKDTQYLLVQDFDEINTIKLGSGVMLDLSYQANIQHYYLEDEDEKTVLAKQQYLDALNIHSEKLQMEENGYKSNEELHIAINNIKTLYNTFINTLKEAIDKYKEEWGMDDE